MRNEFLNKIDEFLVQFGFVKENDSYIKQFQSRTNQQIVINGQQMGSPIINNKVNINLLGEGAIINEDESEVPFELIEFIVEQNNQIVMETNMTFYYNEIETFKNFFNQIFQS